MYHICLEAWHQRMDVSFNAFITTLSSVLHMVQPVDINCHLKKKDVLLRPLHLSLGTRTFSIGSSYYIQNYKSWPEPHFLRMDAPVKELVLSNCLFGDSLISLEPSDKTDGSSTKA